PASDPAFSRASTWSRRCRTTPCSSASRWGSRHRSSPSSLRRVTAGSAYLPAPGSAPTPTRTSWRATACTHPASSPEPRVGHPRADTGDEPQHRVRAALRIVQVHVVTVALEHLDLGVGYSHSQRELVLERCERALRGRE